MADKSKLFEFRGWADVYPTYDAIEKCVNLYGKAAEVVWPYHRLQDRDDEAPKLTKGAAQAAKKLRGIVDKLTTATEVAEGLVEPLAKDMHRANTRFEELVAWGETKAASVGEAVVIQCRKVCNAAWTAKELKAREAHNHRTLLLQEPRDKELILARLNREAARVVEVQQMRGPDLSRLTVTERRVYAIILLHGPIDEKGINLRMTGHPGKGDSRKVAGRFVRFWLCDKVGDGFIVREPGHIVPTDMN